MLWHQPQNPSLYLSLSCIISEMINRKALTAKNVIFMECDVQEPMRRLAKNFKSVLRSAMMM